MGPIKCDGSVPNRKVAAPIRFMNRRMICEAYAKNSPYGVVTSSIAGTAENDEIAIYERSSDEPLGAFVVGSSSHHPQPQAGPSTVGSSSSHPQQQPLAGAPTVGGTNQAPQQQPHQENPTTTNISEDVLKRFNDLQDWAARSGR